MAPGIPTGRPAVTPSRVALTFAAGALAANLYLMLGDAMAHGSASSASVTTACADAIHLRHPGALDSASVALNLRIH